ncbi:AAA family ATPase [Parafilimonas sp.]|uniref:AAA family ATPase n=1 Tax=Parafilimonas sp. TaxID=1969739 RepID=UPI003F7E0733
MIKKIVTIGPESTGKSTLARQLAEHFNTIWCPEYAREYLHQNGVKYDYDDLMKITQGQLAMEDYCTEKLQDASPQLPADSSQLLFIDTNMYVVKVWYEYVFGKCEYLVLDEIARRSYDLYLLCNIDLPWTADEMREYPDEKPRVELYHIYKDLLLNQNTPWIEISGNYEQRLQAALKSINKFL